MSMMLSFTFEIVNEILSLIQRQIESETLIPRTADPINLFKVNLLILLFLNLERSISIHIFLIAFLLALLFH
jgi:hypothetical protein